MFGARVLAGVALASVATLAACDKPPEPSETPASSSGVEVIIETPGQEPEAPPEEPTPLPEDEGNQPPPGGGGTELNLTTIACKSDADCVKDSCCHATSCVAAANAPSCDQTMCTMDCRAGTMDCYGGCSCREGVCAAEIWAGAGP